MFLKLTSVAVQDCPLKVLNLSSVGLTDKCGARIVSALRCDVKLERLDLSRNQLSDHSMAAIEHYLQVTRLSKRAAIRRFHSL